MIGPLLDDGDGVRVDISAGGGAEDTAAGTCSVSLAFESDGDIAATTTSSGSTDAGDWIAPKAAAPGSYEVLLHQDSGDALDGGSAALDTWLALSSTRTITMTQTGAGVKSASFTVSIRLGSTTLSSGTFTLSATAL